MVEETMREKPTSNALELLDRLIGDDSDLRAMIEEENVHAQVAREIYLLRTSRGLSQKQLAEQVGTGQSAIARLEDADYEGHSVRMLRRIAAALGAHLSVRFVPNEALSRR
jgi:ribosome-binding protein aMBF1 (putative translation factor)